MKKWILLLILLGLILPGCKDSTKGDDEPPEKVRWVPKTVDFYRGFERGIDAVGGEPGNVIRLEWYANPESDIAYYKIYATSTMIDNQPVNFLEKKVLDVKQVENIPGFEFNQFADSAYSFQAEISSDFGFHTDEKVYYTIRAIDEKGQIGENSDTLSYKLLTKPDGLDVKGTQGNYYFEWNSQIAFSGGNQLILRVENITQPGIPIIAEIVSDTSPLLSGSFYSDPKIYFSTISDQLGVSLDKTGLMRFRIDVFQDNSTGSESSWFQF